MFRVFAVARLRAELQYRTSFASFVVSQAAITFLDCVAILAIFHRVPQLGGWDRGQVLLLYAVSIISFGIADLLVGSVEQSAEYVRQGSFDRLLIRPAGVLSQMLGDEFALRRLGRPAQGTIVLVVTVAVGHVEPASVLRALFLIPAVVGASITFSAIFVLLATLSFWWPNSKEVGSAFTYGGVTMAQYPTHIYPSWLRRLAVFALPVGVVTYVPVMFALDAPNPLGIPTWAQLLSPLVFAPVTVAAALAWRSGLHRYESTGS